MSNSIFNDIFDILIRTIKFIVIIINMVVMTDNGLRNVNAVILILLFESNYNRESDTPHVRIK